MKRGSLWAAVAHCPDPAPGICETCRLAPTEEADAIGGYCSALCRLFDEALTAHADALTAAAGDTGAPAVVLTRTRLRIVADAYDLARLYGPDPDPRGLRNVRLRREWSLDVADGLVLPLDWDAAVAAIRRDAFVVGYVFGDTPE